MPSLIANTERLVFAPTYGSPQLRESNKTNVINVRGSFFDEVYALMHHLNEHGAASKPKSVGIVYEDGTIGEEVRDQLRNVKGNDPVIGVYNGLLPQTSAT